jgi:hypothetical protein
MQNILTTKFWFSNNPPALLPIFFNLLIIALAIFLLASLAFYVLKRKKSAYQYIFSYLFDFSLTNLFIAILVTFFNYEKITFFSARFWLILWFIELLTWLVFILIKLKKIPERRKRKEKEKEFKKYIPH